MQALTSAGLSQKAISALITSSWRASAIGFIFNLAKSR